MKQGDYQAPAGDLAGYKTLVTDTSSKGLPGNTSKDPEQDYRDRPNVPSSGGYKKQVMPVTPKHEKRREKHQPTPDEPSRRPTYNAPPSSGGTPDEKSIHKDRMRTKSEPGEEYGHPYMDQGPAGIKRRTPGGPTASDLTAGGKPRSGILPSQRQHKELQPLRKRNKLYNRRRRQKMKPYNRRRWRRVRRIPRERKQREKRKDPRFKRRFMRIPGGGYSTAADRTRDWREKHKKKAGVEFEFLHLESGEIGRLRRVAPDGFAVYEFDGVLDGVDLDVLLDEVVFAEDEVADIVGYLNVVLGESYEEGDLMEDEPTAAITRIASRYIEARQPHVSVFEHTIRHKVHGVEREKARRRRRQNKLKLRRAARRRSKLIARTPSLKKRRRERARLRRRNPAKYKLRQGSVLTAPEIAFFIGERLDVGYVHGISPMTGLVWYHRRYGNDFEFESLPVQDFFASVVFMDDLDLEVMMELVEVELGEYAFAVEPELQLPSVLSSAALEGVDCNSKEFKDKCEKVVGKRKLEEMSPSELGRVELEVIQNFVYDEEDPAEFPHSDADEPEERPGYHRLEDPRDYAYVYGRVILPPEEGEDSQSTQGRGKTAEMLYEKVQPHDKDTWHDRGQGWTKKKQRQQEREPGLEDSYPYGFVDNNPGSAKVIPEWHDLANKSERVMKQSQLQYERLPPDKQRLLYQLIKTPEWDRYRRGGPVNESELAKWMTEHGWPMTERGFNNLINQAYRTAALISDIEGRTDTAIHDRAGTLRPKLKRVDVRLGMWTYEVPGSSGTHTVKVKAAQRGNLRNVAKLDVYVKCSCPFWQWQGPEYHAKQGGYLFGTPRGTASEPVVKDPMNRHGACKHVLAVLADIKRIGPLRKEWGQRQGSVERVAARYLADTLANSEIRILSAQRVAARYLGRQRLRREE